MIFLSTDSCAVPSFNHGIIERQKDAKEGVLYCARGYYIKWRDGTSETFVSVVCINDKWYFKPTFHTLEEARDCEEGKWYFIRWKFFFCNCNSLLI
jgi:hypothetical protein